ncbi:MAG: 1-acyl-sn-glycerol-3-phosphate acyltransferase [Cyanobacteria bacterium J06628_6]
MPRSIAQPSLEFIPPNFNPLVRQGVALLIPGWIRWRTALRDIRVENAETLAQLYNEFYQDKTRFLVAFRHPSPDDPYCLAQLFWRAIPQAARQQQIELRRSIHAHFIYDRGIPLWTGRWLGWLYSRLGGISIQRGKLDLEALRVARSQFADGQFPMVAAPEGGNNGHSEIVSPLEPGVAQLGFWCANDLKKANRSASVVIVPVGIQYQYLDPPWTAVEQLLTQLERSCGLAMTKDSSRYERLYRLSEHLLTLMEDYYQRFYHVSLADPASTEPENSLETPNAKGSQAKDPNTQLTRRLNVLLNSALTIAETYFGLTAKGSVIDRCRRLEQAGWDRIFREDIEDRAALSVVERSLADRIAAETDLRLWHMRLVESFVAVTGRYVIEKPTVERFAETLLLLRDMVIRIQDKNPFPRPQLGPQQAIVTVGQPLSVSDRYADYKKSRRRAVDGLTQDLRAEFERLVIQS